MLPKRIIPCLDVERGRVVKGTEFADLRDMGDPVELARRYEAQGADELVFLDVTATSERRAIMTEVVRRVAADVFIPLTVGGGVRDESDVQRLLDAGGDKVAVNSAALAEPELIDRLARRFGRQCVVAAIDAKSDGYGGWDAYACSGRSATGRSAIGWAEEAAQRGAGEILLTSIDRDGTQDGYDINLLQAVSARVDVPVIASGGAGAFRHYEAAIANGGAEAVLAASQLHAGEVTVPAIKMHLTTHLGDSSVREIPQSVPLRRMQAPEGTGPSIAVVDYGVGNRYSVCQALNYVGAEAHITADIQELYEADGIVLPGVGAFRPAMDALRAEGLDNALRRLARLGKPVLGICLGEQLLFSGSEEDGWYGGLNLIPGEVREVSLAVKPNIGWRVVRAVSRNSLLLDGFVDPQDILLPGGREIGYFYHAHQYAAAPDELMAAAGWTRFGQPSGTIYDYQFPSIVEQTRNRRMNIYGVQFHPEKSSNHGLALLENFVHITREYRRSNHEQFCIL